MEQQLLDDRYELLEEVGSGGMAVVYRGRDHRLGGREVAIKVMHPHLAARKESRHRFKNEADAAAKLEHDNILKVFDASDLESKDSYIVMEFVRGETLAKRVEKNPFRIPELGVMVAHEVCRALVQAHRARILHRDIKPENVMVREDGVIKLMDFGIARAMDSNRMTMTGALMGSPAHMAPEHIEGKELDFRADVFSLGTLLYFVTTGTLPFTAPSPHALLRKILEGEYADPQRIRPAVGRRLSRIIARTLARQPEMRYQSMEKVQEDLRKYLGDMGINDPSAELRIWIQNTKKYEEKLRKKVVERLLEMANRAVNERRRGAAIECMNRVMCLDENNKKAALLLQKLNISAKRSSRIKHILIGVAGILAAGILIALVPFLDDWLSSSAFEEESSIPGESPAGQKVSDPSQSPASSSKNSNLRNSYSNTDNPEGFHRRTGVVEQPQDRRPLQKTIVSFVPKDKTRNTPNSKDRGGQRDPGTKENTYPVHMKVFPPAAVLTLNGKTYPELQAGPKTLSLKAGRYRYRVSLPECAACEVGTGSFKIDPKKLLKQRIFKVPVKPAVLVVKTNVPANVSVGGRIRGSSNSPIKIPFDFKDIKAGKDVKVKVHANGYQPRTESFRARPGESRKLEMILTAKQMGSTGDESNPN